MSYPTNLDFLSELGLEPFDEESERCLSWYKVKNEALGLELIFSFSESERTFQIDLEAKGSCVCTICSEMVVSMEIYKEGMDSGFFVRFNRAKILAECKVRVWPSPHVHWYILE